MGPSASTPRSPGSAPRRSARTTAFDSASLQRRVDELDALSSTPDFYQRRDAPALWREREALNTAVTHAARLGVAFDELDALIAMAKAEADESLLGELHHEVAAALVRHESFLARMTLADPDDEAPAIVEIVSGAGGAEAMQWCTQLRTMYLRWASDEGLETELLGHTDGEDGGLKSALFVVRGPSAYGHLRGERGVHRLVQTSAGKRQTSFAAVAVTPDIERTLRVVLKPEEVDRSTMCSSGKGGQNVNKVETAVRLVHKPTGIAVRVQAERSQADNERLAWTLLTRRVAERLQAAEDEAFEARHGGPRSDIAFGHALRSYVLAPYQLVKDHTTGHETTQANDVLQGAIGPLLEAHRYERLRQRFARSTR